MKDNKIPVSQEIKKHLLTGISWMIPLIVAAGICIALGQVLGGTDVGEKTGTIPWMLNQIGGWGMGLIVPLISAAIAYSIADRPGFAPGLIVGFLCGQIHTGFIGGMLGGFLVGYTILLLKRYIRLPQSMQGLMPIMVLPVLSTIIGGLLMMTLIGKPIAWLQEALIHLLESMQGGSRGHTWRDGNLRFRWSGQQNHVAVFRWLAGQWRLRTRSREICRLNHPSVWHHTFVLTDTP